MFRGSRDGSVGKRSGFGLALLVCVGALLAGCDRPSPVSVRTTKRTTSSATKTTGAPGSGSQVAATGNPSSKTLPKSTTQERPPVHPEERPPATTASSGSKIKGAQLPSRTLDTSGKWPPNSPLTPNSLPTLGQPTDPGDALADFTPLSIVDSKLEIAGIKKFSGRRLVLYTDVVNDAVADLPRAFDQAYLAWCAYFGLPADPPGPTGQAGPAWQVTAIMPAGPLSKERFHALGLWRDSLPDFRNGFAYPDAFWLYDQPSSDYYRRHLLLHEGVHSFMLTRFGHCGPHWYREGMAELLATHRWDGTNIELPYFPKDKDEVPMLGRVKIVQDAVATGQPWGLNEVLGFRPSADFENQPYGWCWALAAFLDGHPRYRERFRQLPAHLSRPGFEDAFLERFLPDERTLACEWNVYVTNLEYGYDLQRTVLDLTPGKTLTAAPVKVRIAADRGWQNSGWALEAGVPVQLVAQGRYQVANALHGKSQPWPCEPGGISFRYYHGRPLGQLQVAVVPNAGPILQCQELWQPVPLGLGTTLTSAQSGTLFFRINDSSAELADNAGDLTVEIRRP